MRSIVYFLHGSGAALLHDLRRDGGGLTEGWRATCGILVEVQNAVVPQMGEQWLEVPKIMPQDRILQTAKQIADHLDKRDLARAEKSLMVPEKAEKASQMSGRRRRSACGMSGEIDVPWDMSSLVLRGNCTVRSS